MDFSNRIFMTVISVFMCYKNEININPLILMQGWGVVNITGVNENPFTLRFEKKTGLGEFGNFHGGVVEDLSI